MAIKNFKVSARTILTLGRDSIKDHTTALIELVKNSYDADATRVEVEIYCNTKEPYIRIADNGTGMTDKEVESNWLHIGYSSKIKSKESIKKRRKTGEKGIGRISADRLGASLKLITKSSSSNPYCLVVNWDKFDNLNKELSSIPIEILDKPIIRIPKTKKQKTDSGTELLITGLRQKWNKNHVQDLYEELSILTPPFAKAIDFEVYIKTDITNEYTGKVETKITQAAEIEFDGSFDGEIISYSMNDRSKSSKKASKKKIEWNNLVHSVKENASKLPKFGPASVKLFFFTREAKALEGTKFTLSDLREYLDINAGIKIYRDNIRVKPYGDPGSPDGDWLGLAERKGRDPAGVSRPTFKVGANQIVGALFITRDGNNKLVDSASREGLIHGDEFEELKDFVFGCLNLLETHRHTTHVEKKKEIREPKSPTNEIRNLNQDLKTLRKDLTLLKRQVPKSKEKTFNKALDQVVIIDEKIKDARVSLEELVSQATVYRGLATIGIAAAVFGHETQSSISEFISALYTANAYLKKDSPKISIVIKELEKAEKYAGMVSSWGAFALSRVQRDKRKRKKHNITKLIEDTINEIKPAFNAVNIELKTYFNQIEGKTFAMDVEAVLINLLTNAYTSCLQKKNNRKIHITLKEVNIRNNKGFKLVVADTGTGIDDEFIGRIWEPLFSTKRNKNDVQVGTGLGLTIVQSIVNDLSGEKYVDHDPKLKGARFAIQIPLG